MQKSFKSKCHLVCPVLIFLAQANFENIMWKDSLGGSSFPRLKTLRRVKENTEFPHWPLARKKGDFPFTSLDWCWQTPSSNVSGKPALGKFACILPVKDNWSNSLVRRVHVGCSSSLLEQHFTIRAIEFHFSVSLSHPGPSVAPCAAFRENEVVHTVNGRMHPKEFASEEGLGLIPSTSGETQWLLEVLEPKKKRTCSMASEMNEWFLMSLSYPV